MDTIDERDPRILRALAAMPPRTWARTLERLEGAARYFAGADRSAAAATREAGRLGMSRSAFYDLARVLSRPPRPEPDPGAAGQRPVREAVRRTIEVAGAGSSMTRLAAEARRLSLEQGGRAPSAHAVRIHGIRMLAGRHVRERLRIDADLVLDRSPLDAIVDSLGHPEQAELLCLVDAVAGSIRAHLVTCGPPETADACRLLEAMPERPSPPRVAISDADGRLHRPAILNAVASGGGIAVPGAFRTGAAVRAVLGLRLGAIRLMSRPLRRHDHAMLPPDLVRAVVDDLLARRLLGKTTGAA